MRVPSPPQLRLQRRLLGTEVALGWAGRRPQAGPSLCPASSLCLGRPLQLAGGLPGWGRASSGDPGRWSWPQAGRRVQGRAPVVGSVWSLSPQGWPGHSSPPPPAAGGQGLHSHLPSEDRSCLACPPARGPLEWQGVHTHGPRDGASPGEQISGEMGSGSGARCPQEA